MKELEIKCPICNELIPTYSLKFHLKGKHPECESRTERRGGASRVFCGRCNHMMASWIFFAEHYKKFHIEGNKLTRVQIKPSEPGTPSHPLESLLNRVSTEEELGLLLLSGFMEKIKSLESTIEVISKKLKESDDRLAAEKLRYGDLEEFSERLKAERDKLASQANNRTVKEKVGSVTIDAVRNKLIPHLRSPNLK